MLDLDLNKVNLQWIDWLNNKGIKITYIRQNTDSKLCGKDLYYKSPISNL